MKKIPILIIASLSCITAAQGATPLLIDFGADGGTQLGWEALGGTADVTSANGSYSGYTDLSAGDVAVGITGIRYSRSYTNGAATTDFIGTDLDAMYNDMLFNNNGTLINVTISGLSAGAYHLTTHHLINTPNPGVFSLNVQDANSPAFGQSMGSFTQGTGSASTFNPNVINYTVLSNGTDPIILRMAQGVPATTGGTTGGWYGFSGMEIAVAPEPSTTALLGLGGLALILRRRK